MITHENVDVHLIHDARVEFRQYAFLAIAKCDGAALIK